MILQGDALSVLKTLPERSVHSVVTSPPYFGLRDYATSPVLWPEVTYAPMSGVPSLTIPAWEGELGQEADPAAFIGHLLLVFREAARVLRDDGVMLVNLGDSYASDGLLPNKNLVGIPWRFALAMQADGLILRQDIIWAKGNAMPESVKDRCTKAHEYIFLFSKQPQYFWDAQAIAEPTVALGGKADTVVSRASLGNLAGGGRAALVSGQKGQAGTRAQLTRALELAEQHGLTEAHLNALRAVGMSAQPKHGQRQTGAGKNSAQAQRLADEARAALGSHAAEFLTGATKNRRSWWLVNPEPAPFAHFAVMSSQLARDMVLASTPAQVCPNCGRAVSKTPCGCFIGEPDAYEIIGTPLGEREGDDLSWQIGRAGLTRPRGEREGRREITRYEQRRYADQLRVSPHRVEMEAQAGKEAFAHYLRKDRSGARPVPPELLTQWLEMGWLSSVALPQPPRASVAGVVLDPFVGSGTTYREALKVGRECIGIELHPANVKLAQQRVRDVQPGLGLVGA